jgi:DNA-3-methyladenine glycosylase
VETDESPRLGAGPGKLTKLLGIDGSAHGTRFLHQEDTGIFFRKKEPAILTGPRIGITRARELEWRFGATGSAALSAKF